MLRKWIPACLLASAVVGPLPAMAATDAAPVLVTYSAQTFPAYTYANFLHNWDDARQPLFYGVMRSLDEYKASFSAAAVMGNTRPYFPPASLFETSQLLVVSRVTVAQPNGASAFSVEFIREVGQDLHVRYRFQPSSSGMPTSMRIKDGLEIQVPRKSYARIVFFENGQQVGSLSLKDGQRLVTDAAQ